MSTGTVGARVAAIREAKKVSAEELAARTRLSVTFIGELERDEVHPPLAVLFKVARALGVRLGTFIDDQVSEDPFVVRRRERTEELTASRGKDMPTALRFYSLGRGKSDRNMEPFFVEVLEESANDETESSHEGEEFLVVLTGSVGVRYGGKEQTLEPGDSIYFNSIVPHRIWSIGGRATVHAVIYVPR
jgi:transcriptional regulator with XRE-family HTH domain